MKLHVILTKGLQCSGKSFFSKQFVKDHQDYKRVNRDEIRHMLSSYTFDTPNEELVTSIEQKILFDLIDRDFNIVIDNMHLNEKTIENTKKFIQHCAHTEVEFEIKEFPVTLSEALARDAKRSFPIGEKVIKDTWRRYEVELKAMLNRAKPKNSSNSEGTKAVLVDLDGTLAHAKHRNIYDEGKVDTDEIIPTTRDLVCSLARYCGYKIIILSGRHESCKDKTVSWLEANDVSFDYIFMRKTGDDRKDTIIKKELYYAHIKNQYNVVMAIDDRPCVGDLWVSEGIPLINVNNDPYCKNNF